MPVAHLAVDEQARRQSQLRLVRAHCVEVLLGHLSVLAVKRVHDEQRLDLVVVVVDVREARIVGQARVERVELPAYGQLLLVVPDLVLPDFGFS